MLLYHKDIFFPYELTKQFGDIRLLLDYTRHAKKEAKDESIVLPLTASLSRDNLIEIGTTKTHTIQKLVYRIPYDDTRDISLVFGLPTWKVKTVWLNNKNDNHDTLDESRYERTYGTTKIS